MSLQALLCRHAWYWSERHQADRCRRCGKLNAEAADAPPPLRLTPMAQPEAPPADAPPVFTRARTLPERLDRLAAGQPLSHDELLNTVIELIEDGHVASPQLDSAAAALHVARLSAARRVPA